MNDQIKERLQKGVRLRKVDASRFKGHEDYRRYLNRSEFMDYVKNHKGRFAKGLGIGALGLTGVGLGGHLLLGGGKGQDRKKKR